MKTKKKKPVRKKEKKAMPTKTLSRNRRTAAEKKLSTKKVDSSFEASIDYPTEGELVVPGHYAVRISAKAGFDVELSTDGKIWHATRPSVGYHWFDWMPNRTGPTVLSVRVKAGKGRWKTTTERECIVIGSSSN